MRTVIGNNGRIAGIFPDSQRKIADALARRVDGWTINLSADAAIGRLQFESRLARPRRAPRSQLRNARGRYCRPEFSLRKWIGDLLRSLAAQF